MRFNEIVTEETDEELMQRIAATIKKDCQPYLKAVPKALGKNALFRGMSGTKYEPFITKSVRLTDRQAADMSENLHNDVNKFFVKKFGQPFRNALFASSDAWTAETYGTTYIIFPIGDFKILWSPDIADMFGDYEDVHYEVTQDEDYTTEDINSTFLKRIVNAKWSTDITAGIKSGNEIMLRCKQYHAIIHDEYNVITDITISRKHLAKLIQG